MRLQVAQKGRDNRTDDTDLAAAVEIAVLRRRRARLRVGRRQQRADLVLDQFENLGGGEDLLPFPLRRRPIGMYSMKRSSWPWSRAKRASGTISRSLIARVGPTAFSLIGSKPADSDSAMPART